MKQIVLLLFIVCCLSACRKNESPATPDLNEKINQVLSEGLSPVDYVTVDFTRVTQTNLPGTKDQMVRLAFKEKNPLHDCILLQTDPTGAVKSGHILHIEGKISLPDRNGKPFFNGQMEISNLHREEKKVSSIVNGFVMSLHTSNIKTNGVRTNYDCSDCTIPEVIVSASYNNGGISWGAWMSFLAMFDGGGSQNDYLLIDYGGGGGGGGGSAPPPAITIDIEAPENKEKIDPKKYTDCFGTIPDNGATCSITISADLPVDGHPETFFNWTDRSPGHAFIELNKSTPYGSVSQDIGFYPNTSFKVLTGGDIGSKIIDDGGHEYQARYTITVTPAQFQAAIDAINANSSNPYNVSHYNCTDFALAVFNAAGGGLTIPRHGVPGFEIDGGSNTPQGLYEKISQLKDNGTAGTTKTNNKEYAGPSKGPCN